MPAVAYPKELTQAHWDKKKGIIAKTKPTGIGKALVTLKKAHDAVNWADIKPTWCTGIPTVLMLKKNYDTKKKAVESTVDPIEGMAKSINTLASKWEKTFKGDKLVPASAVKAAKEVADAATEYAKKIAAVAGELDTEMEDGKKLIVAAVRSTLKPTMKNHLTKVDKFLSDIDTFASKASDENLQKLTANDSGARGFCTACTYWDEVLVDYPDVIGAIFSGKAETFKAPVNEYGAGRKYEDIQALVDKTAIKKKVPYEDALRVHAEMLKKEAANVKKFRGYLDSAIKKLG